MTTKRRNDESGIQFIKFLASCATRRLNAGKEEAAVLQTLAVSQSTYDRWRQQYGGRKAEEAKRLQEPEEGNKRLKRLVAGQALDVQRLKHITEGNR